MPALRFVLVLALVAAVGCSHAESIAPVDTNIAVQVTNTPPAEQPPSPEPGPEIDPWPTGPAVLPKSIAERRLETHFERYELKPLQTIDSRDLPEQPGPLGQLVNIGSHRVEWVTEFDTKDVRSLSLRINGDQIPIAGEMTKNQIDEDDRQDAGWANDIWRIRLYKLNDRELIGIEMIQRSCTGLSCSVGVQLLYDLKTKKQNYFGTFRTDSEIRLFRFAGKGQYYYVSKSCDCINADGKYIVTYNLYRMNPDGDFVSRNAPKQKPYFIRHSFYPAEFEPYTGRVIPPKEPDKLEHNWIRPIK